MELIPLTIKGISYSQTQMGAYALILSDEVGGRKLPVVIGVSEAQSIAIALEDEGKPARPLTHDLFCHFAKSFDIELKRVVIHKLVDGVFHSNIVWQKKGSSQEVITDSRTSDAVALAVRTGAPIYTYRLILDTAGIYLETDYKEEKVRPSLRQEKEMAETSTGPKVALSDNALKNLSLSELSSELEKAVSHEDYERAAAIRDEMEARKR